MRSAFCRGVRERWGQEVNLVPRVLSYKQREPGNEKIFKHFGCYSGLRASKYAWLNIGRSLTLGRERAYYSENKSVRSKNLKNFPKNSRETVSVSTICDEYCSRDDSIDRPN